MSTNSVSINLFIDNEGPCTLNDNAQENTVALATACGVGKQVGIAFYHNTSNIDDIWGNYNRVLKDPSYSSGHTLKVVLPFFRAMGATRDGLCQFARDSLRVVPNVGVVLRSLSGRCNVWQISTSYDFFVRAFCDAVGFDFTRVRCTAVPLFDELGLTAQESQLLREFVVEAAAMPEIQYDLRSGQVAPIHAAHYDRFTQFVWETLWSLDIGELLRSVRPVGQRQKREAVEGICREQAYLLEQTMYVGDSETDVECVRLLQGRGLTMIFNGKGRVFELADIAYIGRDARAIQEVAMRFAQLGREGTIAHYSPEREAGCGGVLATITPGNTRSLHERSVKERQAFRGIAIGSLS